MDQASDVLVKDRAGGAIARVAILALVGVAMLAWTWERLGDPFIDWGRELYVAWRASDRAVVYRDVEYLYGPLPLWINAAWFTIFGTSIRTLVLCNALILAGITLVLYRILRRFSAPWPATAAGALFLLLFGFGNFVGYSNYNYLTPYAHGLTHGLALLLVTVWSIIRWHECGRARWLALAAANAGLCTFTKPEIALAAVVVMFVGMPMVLWAKRCSMRESVQNMGIVAGSAIGIVVIVLGLMMVQLPPRDALRGVVAAYIYAFDPQITTTKFYRFGLGVEHPSRSLWKVAVWCAHYGQVLIPAALVALAAGRLIRTRAPVVALLVLISFAAAFAIVWSNRFEMRWADALRGLTGVTALVVVALLIAVIRSRGSRRQPLDARLVSALLFALIAGALLAKMALNVRLHQYGFVLAMPATILATIALLDWMPRLLARAGGDGRIFFAASAGMLTAVVVVHLQVCGRVLSGKDVRLASGADTIHAAGENGRMLGSAIDELRRRLQPGQTLAVLPEAATVNYLLRAPNPTPFDQLNPIAARVFGEVRVTRAFIETPPDWIVLVHQDTSIFGPRHLGRDYLRELGRWIDGNYEEVWRAGEPPLTSLQFGISIRRARR